ncbi:ribonuclease D [Aeromicrobium tamlense]|uniref:Ribonuclease D n=1 Tax=Aeromicrobium tamlense TaxID=375541 RepID=A0A8I0KLQ8_9ACTN|nr:MULTISPECIES: HRDC domain-containing protein [Aeromicrobium]MBD1270323.1 ribonuclease D [Aeromicrobium tamlense]MBD1271545.1 ribonuclease D [Aeromicrobium tamlense]NYI37709.1 ribonuclease D [Aeromicrobium tamlense]
MTNEPEEIIPDEAPEPVLPRLGLREPLTPVVDTEDALARACAEISLGEGPIALDAERASGYRYSQRAYLVQVRREGSGSWLIDPIAFPDLTELGLAFGDAEWILHAATQDLPCLAEVGLRPASLFDTELAGRLLNLPRVGLAALVEHYLGMSLAKEFSAADWSTRPLPEPWLEYAALDVEVLLELRELVLADLVAAGKDGWAREEFDALLSFTGPPERKDPWRRTSSIHKIRSRRSLAIVRALWHARDAIAADRDVTPGRILPDASIVALATQAPTSLSALKDDPTMRRRGPRRFLDDWFTAIESALGLPEDELPTSGQRSEGPPPPRAWADKDPVAAARLVRVRAVVAGIAEEHNLPAENLVGPALVRGLAWQPPADLDPESIAAELRERGSRNWQIELVAAPIAAALVDP